MRVRTKDCLRCGDPKEVLYRCRYGEQKDWSFLFEPCLLRVKQDYQSTYQYAATWKSKKR